MENELENCVFCNYDKNKLIRESENTITILSNPYLLRGHSLVIPKKHYESIFEIPGELALELFDEITNIGKFLIEKLRVGGIDIRHNYRPFLKESKFKVNHLHFHVIPRTLEDELYKKSMIYERDVFKDLTNNDFNELKEILR